VSVKNLNLSDLKVPNISGYESQVGEVITENSTGRLSVSEAIKNNLMPFICERPITITEETTIADVDYNAFLIINSESTITLTLKNGNFLGVEVRVANYSDYVQNVNEVVMGVNSEVIFTWNGTKWIPSLKDYSPRMCTSDTDTSSDFSGVYTVNCSNFVLVNGVELLVTFTNAQTYSGQPKLNVAGTGNIPVTIQGVAGGINCFVASGSYRFKYDSSLNTFDCINSPLISRPVGSLYWSSNSTSPAILFGGTWEQIKDKFIYAAGTYSAGTTGGTSTGTVTLTTANLPNHYHYLNKAKAGVAKFTGTSGTTSAVQPHLYLGSYSGNWGQVAIHAKENGYASTDSIDWAYDYGVEKHSHTFTPSGSISGQTDSTGSGTSFSIMPPYLVMYCWKRTA
jgi:hypothetical protein